MIINFLTPALRGSKKMSTPSARVRDQSIQRSCLCTGNIAYYIPVMQRFKLQLTYFSMYRLHMLTFAKVQIDPIYFNVTKSEKNPLNAKDYQQNSNLIYNFISYNVSSPYFCSSWGYLFYFYFVSHRTTLFSELSRANLFRFFYRKILKDIERYLFAGKHKQN